HFSLRCSSTSNTTTPEIYPLSLHDALPIWIKCTTKQSNSAHSLLHSILVKLSAGFLLIVYTIQSGSQLFAQCEHLFLLIILLPVHVCLPYSFVKREF